MRAGSAVLVTAAGAGLATVALAVAAEAPDTRFATELAVIAEDLRVAA